MTEDTSPENLRKFLESDEPALRRMGLSMAKGGGVPEDLYKNVFGLSLWDPEEENREAATELVEEIGLENITEFPGWLEPFDEEDIVEDDDACDRAVDALGEISGVPAPGRAHHFATGTVQQRWCAVDLLIEALGDGSSSGSWSAASVLGDIGDTDAVEPLIWVLSNYRASEAVRESAAEALGKIGDTQAVEPLFGALIHKHYDMRRAAAMALVEFGEQTVEPLIKMLDDDYFPPNSRARSNPGRTAIITDVAWVLGEIGDARAVEPLIKALGEEDSYLKGIRQNAAGALDKLGWVPESDRQKVAYLIATEDWKSLVEWGEPAVEHLIGALSDDWNRESAAGALGEIGKPAVEPLIKALSDDYYGTREGAAMALGEIGGARAVKALIDALETEPSRWYGEHRNYNEDYNSTMSNLVNSLGKTGDVRAVELLINALWDEYSEEVRDCAVVALGGIGEPAIPELVNSLGQNDSVIRSGVAKALELIGWKSDGNELQAAYLIGREDWKGCVELGESAVEPLIETLAGEPLTNYWSGEMELDLRIGAAETLGELSDKRAVEPLCKIMRTDGYALEDANYTAEFRKAVVKALEKIGDSRAVEPLLHALELASLDLEPYYDDDEVHAVIAEALKKLGHEVE